MPDPSADPLPLDLIGIREGTDKSSLRADYLRHYERLFAPWRDEQFNIIEIGVFGGASLRMWQRFFSRAQIVGVDIDPRCRSYAGERITVEIGSQNDPTFLHRLATNYPPRIVVDDGSHKSYDAIFTFERLFPTLEAGGIYVIEDLHFHFDEADAERLRGGSPILATDYVANFSKDRLRNESQVRQLSGLQHYLIDAVERVEIISMAAVFFKKQESPHDLDALWPHVEASGNWLNWLLYSQKLLNAQRPISMVIDSLQRAIALNKGAMIAYHRLAEAQEIAGDPATALATLQSAVAEAASDADRAALAGRMERLRNARQAGSSRRPYAAASHSAATPEDAAADISSRVEC
jgi:hypothetical protein